MLENQNRLDQREECVGNETLLNSETGKTDWLYNQYSFYCILSFLHFTKLPISSCLSYKPPFSKQNSLCNICKLRSSINSFHNLPEAHVHRFCVNFRTPFPQDISRWIRTGKKWLRVCSQIENFEDLLVWHLFWYYLFFYVSRWYS